MRKFQCSIWTEEKANVQQACSAQITLAHSNKAWWTGALQPRLGVLRHRTRSKNQGKTCMEVMLCFDHGRYGIRGRRTCYLRMLFSLNRNHVVKLSWRWGVWDPTLGFPGEGPPEIPLLLISINCTAWNSLMYVLRNGEMAGYDVIAIQEHKLSQEDISKAQADILALGWRSFFASCVITDKGGKSAGVGFLWKKSIHIISPGKTFCDPRKLTLEIAIHDWGPLLFLWMGFKTSRRASVC